MRILDLSPDRSYALWVDCPRVAGVEAPSFLVDGRTDEEGVLTLGGIPAGARLRELFGERSAEVVGFPTAEVRLR